LQTSNFSLSPGQSLRIRQAPSLTHHGSRHLFWRLIVLNGIVCRDSQSKLNFLRIRMLKIFGSFAPWNLNSKPVAAPSRVLLECLT